jgi:N-acyl-D-aspartate/D-glutamate deacylase
MLDTLIKGGLVVDGTGGPARRADVGIRDGRVVAIGKVDESARRVVEVDGQIVSPGFIDIHTHYDAQAFWDPTLSPTPLHGVTSVIGGNCGFSIAPTTAEDSDYLMRMLARVEGMPLTALETGVPWDWQSTAEFLSRLDGTLMINAGFLVGHSAIRRTVMHEDATVKEATPDQIAEMGRLLAEGLAAGGLGFSSTNSPTHNDHNGDPVPSRFASKEEFVTLAGVVRDFPGTSLEFIGGLAPYSEETFDLMAKMSSNADRPLNWNVLMVTGDNDALVAHQLDGSGNAETKGGRVLALTLPDQLRLYLNFASGFVLDLLPGWQRLMALPDDQKLRALSNPEQRAEMGRLAATAVDPVTPVSQWGEYELVATETEQYRPWVGRSFADLAASLGKTPWDALIDVVVADRLSTVITKPDTSQDKASWNTRVKVWQDRRVVVGASDAGAHVDMIDSFNYTTTLLARAVRDHQLLSVEEAVHLITDRPARLYGLRERGQIKEGWHADLVVFDPTTVGPQPIALRNDLPGGARRMYGEADGIAHVFVNGNEVVNAGGFSEARPGHLLRSGRDTETVRADTSAV